MDEPGRSPLTPAEWRVLERLARGESDRQIAAALALSPWTIHGCLASIYRLLARDAAGNRRVGAVRWYLRHVPARLAERGVADHAAWGTLTAQQRVVLGRLAAGQTDEAIAHGLGLALRTVKQHLNAIYRVVPRDGGENKRVTAAVWYLRAGHTDHGAASGFPADAAPRATSDAEWARTPRHADTGPDDGDTGEAWVAES